MSSPNHSRPSGPESGPANAPARRKPFPWRFPLVLALLVATSIAARRAQSRTGQDMVRPLESVPSGIAGWRYESDEPVDADALSALAATSYLSRTYRRNADQLSLFVAYYAAQQGGRAVHSPKNCLPGNGWEIRSRNTLRLQVDGRPVEINHYLIQNDSTRLALLHWYQSGNRIVTNEYLGKILLLRDALLEGRSANSSVRVIVPPTPEAVKGGAEFAAGLILWLRDSFAAAAAPPAPKS